MIAHYLRVLSAVLLGAVLLSAALGKWLDLAWFASVLRKYGLVSEKLAAPLALTIALLETFDGAMFLFPATRTVAAALGAGMFAIFTGAVSINLMRGRFDVDCGCGGPSRSSKIGWHLVIRNSGLVGLSCVAGWAEIEPWTALSPWILTGSVLLIAIPLLSRPRGGCQGRRQEEVATPV